MPQSYFLSTKTQNFDVPNTMWKLPDSRPVQNVYDVLDETGIVISRVHAIFTAS